jgi:pyruvate formate lyase activating enzyme
MHCLHCQNAEISQVSGEPEDIIGKEIEPALLVDLAKQHQCKTISYTYTEPVIFLDYAVDTARIAGENGLRNVFVTNGYFSKEALNEVSSCIDAANVDLKAFKDETYRKVCGARLQPVLDTIEGMKKCGLWVEVTTLVIPGLNDSEEELRDIADFIFHCDPGIPWHVSRFHPAYKMLDRQSTPLETLRKAQEIGKEAGLKYIYTGNFPGDDGENTRCGQCGALLIHRWGFQVQSNRIQDGKCPECGAEQPGIWK